ncbi:hypothetical protein AAFF_G00273380 [Aldrovandia affinis]|uniref:Uncharacterized protein n=1 Tax=Aldrovandia affinis TaxID=143900 RepID=A0AAD7STF3_9TELE|nr:hypothetical protein AAFF_G00273380 [Aldrovandia affinis]
MQRIAMVMCLIGLCVSIPTLNEHERTEHSASNENTNQVNVGRTQVSTGLTGANGEFQGSGRNGRFSQDPAQILHRLLNPFDLATEMNPLAPTLETSPVDPNAPQEQSSQTNLLLLILPFLIARLRATPAAAPSPGPGPSPLMAGN